MATSSAPTSTLTVTDLVDIFRNHWLWVIGTAFVGAALAVALTFVLAPVYSSSADVLVNPLPSDTGDVANGRSSGLVNLDTEVQIATSLEVADRMLTEMNWPDNPVDITKRLRVSVPANTSVMVITFSAPTAEAAQQGANAFAEAYLDNRAEVEAAARKEQLDRIDKRIKQLKKSDSASANQQIATLETQRDTIAGTVANPGRIIAPAQLPLAPESPRKSIFAVAGFLIGLILGSTLAYLRWRANNTLRTQRDVERAANAQVVAELPTTADIVRSRQDHDLWLRGVRTLSLGLVGASGSVRIHSVAVLSIGCDTGVALAHDLAATVRHRGLRCAIHTLEPTEPVADDAKAQGIARDSWDELRKLRSENDVVIVSASELPTALDLLEGAQLAEAAILTVRLGTPTAATLRQVTNGLEQMDIGLVGVVTVNGQSAAPQPKESRSSVEVKSAR